MIGLYELLGNPTT